MSADNGVYLLRTKDGYRVCHNFASSVDNIYWDYEKREKTNAINLEELYRVFSCASFFKNKEDAYKKAFAILGEVQYTEYGICLVDLKEVVFPKERPIMVAIDSVIDEVADKVRQEEDSKEGPGLMCENWKSDLSDEIRKVLKSYGRC